MTEEYVLSLTDARATLERVGGKGASLARLAAAGLPVPGGYHVTTAAYHRFVAENDLQPGIRAALDGVDTALPATLEAASQAIGALFAAAPIPAGVAQAIAEAYGSLAEGDPAVAVRSSATAEDLPEASFAGQQDTYLNVRGRQEVLEAVKSCWTSLWTARAIGYRARQGIGLEGLSLAVVVQALIPARGAGVLFTAHPVTGRRREAVISAAWGLGEAVVGGLVTPDTLVVDKADGAVLEREIADKQVMTVRVNGGTRTEPTPAELCRAPVLDDESAAELVRLGVQIEELYGTPVDIEWALTEGSRLAILQARPITALPPEASPEPEVKPPEDWPMPDPKGPYMRGSVADFMPDPLSPLFATIGLPALDAGMRRTMDEMIGGGMTILDGYFITINDYIYMHLALGCRDWLWVLFKMGPAIPRLMRNGAAHYREVARPRYAEIVDRWRGDELDELSAADLLRGVDELTGAMAHYVTTLQVDTLGAAAGAEGLFTVLYDKLARREGDPPAATLLLGANSLPIQAEKALYDLAQWARARGDLAAYLLATPTDRLVDRWDAETPPAGVDGDDWREWRQRFGEYLEHYGHGIYDLDFAKPVPADDPLPLLEAFKLFLRGQGANPHERQQNLADRREEAIRTVLGRTRGLKGRLLRWALGYAQTFGQAREDSIFDIGLGYPLLHRMLEELGRRLTAGGALARSDDIYWLERDEVDRAAEALDLGRAVESMAGRVGERRAVWKAEKKLTPPPQLPPKVRVMGVKADAFLPTTADEQTGATLKGVGASPGQVTATARVLHGPEDFGQMRPGDVLVAEITTPAWTPLFAMAAAVITDVGGPLSHGSIVAREYGIPAVLGTGVATQRIQSGQTVTVDGGAGTVVLH